MNSRHKKSMFVGYLFLAVAAMIIAGAGCDKTDDNIPKALGTVTGDDGSVWEQVSEPGFDDDGNVSVVAMQEYKGRLYAVTRNDEDGCEVWRTDGNGWEQVEVTDGEKNGIYGNPTVNNVWARMIVFKDKLYVGFSAGLQGTYRNSTGCEIWRFDGSTWEPMVSDRRDSEETGELTAISGCADGDDDITALFTDSSKSWQEDQWAGGVLLITDGDGAYRKFAIVSNTADTLVVQQNEVAGNEGAEYTNCDEQTLNNPFPAFTYTIGQVEVGDAYAIGTGSDESGFGEFWNKTITAMVAFDNKLYVSTGLNYDVGAQVWYSADGSAWQVTSPPNSFGNYHDNPDYKDGLKAISSSITDLCVSSVSGEPVLYAGGTGTSGPEGSCSRLARLTDSGWELIVDKDVDENDTGTNENGFGSGMACTMTGGNFMPWDLIDYQGLLYVGINSLDGIRILYTETGSADDTDDAGEATWQYSVGGDTPYPQGFDGEILPDGLLPGTLVNIAPYLYVYGDELYVGVVAQKGTEQLHGSEMWKSPDGLTWEPVTSDSFGDNYILAFEAFTTFNGTLYVSASNASATDSSGKGAKIYRLAD